MITIQGINHQTGFGKLLHIAPFQERDTPFVRVNAGIGSNYKRYAFQIQARIRKVFEVVAPAYGIKLKVFIFFFPLIFVGCEVRSGIACHDDLALVQIPSSLSDRGFELGIRKLNEEVVGRFFQNKLVGHHLAQARGQVIIHGYPIAP